MADVIAEVDMLLNLDLGSNEEACLVLLARIRMVYIGWILQTLC